MKIKLTTILLILAIASSAIAEAWIDYINASSQGESIKIEWKSGTEKNLKHYKIERSPANITSFVEITTVQPKGNNSFYAYTDDTAFKTTGMLFKYRLKIVDNNGIVSYSKEVSVTSGVSDVRRTWGSIKAMFR